MDTPITRAEHEEFRRRLEEENRRQDKRIELLESRDGELWRKVVSYAVTAIVGIVIGFVAKQLGM